MPHHPWPVSSLQHRPTVLQQASQPTFLSCLLRPCCLLVRPSCHLGPVPARTAPSFHSIHKQAPLNPILQQAPLNSIIQQAPLNSIHQQAPLSSIHQQATLNSILQQEPLPYIHQQVPPNPIHFVVGSGFLPIPYKLVVAITSGQFVDFSSLLVKPSEPLPSGPVISIDGRVVVSRLATPSRHCSLGSIPL